MSGFTGIYAGDARVMNSCNLISRTVVIYSEPSDGSVNQKYMKQIQNLKAIVLGTVISLVSLVSNATEPPKNTSELIYMGIVDKRPAFRLTLNNNEAALYTVTISDRREGTLYTQKINAKNKTFLFQLDVNDITGEPLQVEVRNAKTRQTETFSINLESRTVLETSVSKL